MIFQSLLPWLRQPYPFERTWGHILRVAGYSGLFILLFLFVLRPFGTQVGPGEEGAYLGICALFGLVTSAIVLGVSVFARLLPDLFDESHWQVWKELAFTAFFIGLIGAGNLLMTHWVWGYELSVSRFWRWQAVTFSVGIIPTMFGVFIGHLKMQKRYAEGAARLSAQVLQPHPPTAHPPPVVFSGDNQNEQLHIEVDQLAYLAAADNYVQVFYLEQGGLKTRLLRSTLKKMEQALAAHPQCFRCHRTFLVNLDFVERVTGNAQGYRLVLRGVDTPIPVSRALNEAVQERLGA